LLAAPAADATETEHLGIRVLPAPGRMTIDGRIDDWDLTGGLFVCGDAEKQRDEFGTWIHAMYDAERLYLLARWVDHTPMNNPGSLAGGYGFQGDCLQVRFITAQGTPRQTVTNWTCWRDRDGKDAMHVELGGKLSTFLDYKAKGAQQAFAANADGKGYVQEMAIPWKLILPGGAPPLRTGDSFIMTVEPNFTIGSQSRMSNKDIFKAGVAIDRVFTFTNLASWGIATLEPQGHVAPRPVRLSDGREFPVRLENGLPTIDWTGLIKSREFVGFKPLHFELSHDGYVSLVIKDREGVVVRHLLNADFFLKGQHEIKWDGLTTWIWRTPGQPVPAGTYTWSAICHQGIGLTYRGFAGSSGIPWDNGMTTGWGGDQGPPSWVASDALGLYLCWQGAEAGKGLVACDTRGHVRWKMNRGGFGGAEFIAVDRGAVFVAPGAMGIYRLDAKTGAYTEWSALHRTNLALTDIWPDPKGKPESFAGMDAAGGKVYLTFGEPRIRKQGVKIESDLIVVLDGQTGKVLKKLASSVHDPGAIKAVSDTLLYVIAGGRDVVAVNPQTGAARPVVRNLSEASAVTVDKQGNLFVSVRGGQQQVRAFTAAGKPLGEIGNRGGRQRLGPWQPGGMLNPRGLVIDTEGQLWVAEQDFFPSRFSVWRLRNSRDATSGSLAKEFLGPTHYGASGGAISPDDPNVMVGTGCEWKLDPRTGRATCVGVFERALHSFAQFCRGSNGRAYLAVNIPHLYMEGPVQGIQIFERLGPAQYKLRAAIRCHQKEKTTDFWADRNNDGVIQPDEVVTLPQAFSYGGYYTWSIYLSRDLTLTGGSATNGPGGVMVKVKGFTSCNAPIYDTEHATTTPAPGGAVASPDNKLLLSIGPGPGPWGNRLICLDARSGKAFWSYPCNWFGVHGSHEAPGPESGLLRGVFGMVGSAKLGSPIDNLWALNTNVGEWHLFSSNGYYLGRLFQSDLLKVQWPDAAVPGADMSNTPPGAGGEDFGGSLVQGRDGKIYVEAGKTAYWNLRVTGLEDVKEIAKGTIAIGEDDVKLARSVCERQFQAAVGKRQLAAKRLTPKFTGNIDGDFQGSKPVAYRKTDESEARSVVAWDERNLYLGWRVTDKTPWVNGATEPAMLYLSGDTVDLQLATNPKADPKRTEAAAGDLRLSIGNFQGKPTAVLYRRVAVGKKPRSFNSGVFKNYVMQYVDVLPAAQLKVVSGKDFYTVEAAVPLAALGLEPRAGQTLRGDLGVTFGDPAGQRTRLRSYWSNQHTGIVDDAVDELMLRPTYWGEIQFAR
jgi:hypothetical protein